MCVYCSCEGLTKSEDFSYSLLANSHTKFFEFLRKWPVQVASSRRQWGHEEPKCRGRTAGSPGTHRLSLTNRRYGGGARYHEAPGLTRLPEAKWVIPPWQKPSHMSHSEKWNHMLEIVGMFLVSSILFLPSGVWLESFEDF
jgi:hypothetical protein